MDNLRVDMEITMGGSDEFPSTCPRCDSYDLDYDNLDFQGTPYQNATCQHCGLWWSEDYRPRAIIILGLGEDEDEEEEHEQVPAV